MWNQRGVWTAAAVVLAGVGDGGPVVAQCDPEETAKLTASDGAAGDLFGDSVSISGEVAVIGASRHAFGSAYVYRYDGAKWVEDKELGASDGAVYDSFGHSVSISGDAAVIAAFGDDDHGFNSGSAYVFRDEGGTWVEEQKLTASDATERDEFGSSVSISGDVAVIGASLDGDDWSRSGSAYVFRYDGATWVEDQKLTASDAAADDFFGHSVSVSGNVALIGAYRDDDNGSDSGSAYVFRYDGATWVEEHKLTASDAAADDSFGASVSTNGDVAVIGAWGDDDNGSDSGSAYVFRWNGATWMEEAKLTASDGAAEDYFGNRVSTSGDVAVIGATGDNDNGNWSGSAYVFRHDGATWVETAKLTASDGAAEDIFGSSVSISGGVAVIGARFDDDNGDYSGSAYVFDLNCPAACPADLDGDGAVGFGDILAALAAWGPCEGCPEDLDDDGVVGMREILIMLSAWGPCE